MSMEAIAITRIVDGGVVELRRMYGLGANSTCFPVYAEEFEWIEKRLTDQKPVNRRTFIAKFENMEWVPTKDTTDDIAHELMEDRAFQHANRLLQSFGAELERDNAMELLGRLRNEIGNVTRAHSVLADVDLDDYEHVLREMKEGLLLKNNGIPPGIPTGIPHLDHHWGGLMPGAFIEVMGRTGEGKSYKMLMFAWAARKLGYRVGLFTPEFNEHDVRCRYHTLASADPAVQKACGLERSFRNRALWLRQGFSFKQYSHFCRYIKDEVPGKLFLLSASGRSDQLSVGYIEDRIVNLELDLVLVDPIYLLKPERIHREGNTYQEVAWVAEALHLICKRYNVPIVFSNQAHVGSNKGDAPDKGDSWGSKTLIHIVSNVLSVQHRSNDNTLNCRGTKSRFGQSNFRYEYEFLPNTGYLKNLTPISGDYYSGGDRQGVEDEADTIISNAVRKGARANGKVEKPAPRST